MIEAALHAWVERVTHDLHGILELYALASTKLRCHASAVTGRPDRMVFNRSFLVTAETVPDFRWAFSDQQHAHKATGLILELRGPWPPYNFCPTLSESAP